MGHQGFTFQGRASSVNDDSAEVYTQVPVSAVRKVGTAKALAKAAFEANLSGFRGADGYAGFAEKGQQLRLSWQSYEWFIYPREYNSNPSARGPIVVFSPASGSVKVFKDWDDYHRRTD